MASKFGEEPMNCLETGDASPVIDRHIPLAKYRIDSRHLFVGTREITIDHGGEIYRLRLTGQNKLILTK